MTQMQTVLSPKLARRLFPLVLLTMTLVSLSAPSAFFWLQLRSLQQESDQVAQQIASFLQQEASQHPRLWRYDAFKLFRHLRFVSQQKHLLVVRVLDPQGAPLLQHQRQAPTTHLQRARWASVPLFSHAQQPLGVLWIALSTEEIRQQTMLLWLVFSLLGLGLASLLYRLPLQTIQHTEETLSEAFTDLRQTQEQLTQANLNLEATVQVRTQELEQAYQQLQEKERIRRKISQRSLAIQENERRAISRDLHDAAGQTLTAIRINLQLLSSLPSPKTKLLPQTMQLVDQTIEEIRRAVRQLTPTILEDRGLTAALHSLCADLQERLQLTLHIDIAPSLPPLPAEIELACYRITQEALTNIARHAHATALWMQLDTSPQRDAPQQLHLHITDDGDGLTTPQDAFPQGSGLQGIRERVELLDGNFHLSTPPSWPLPAPPKGTHLAIQIPLQESDPPYPPRGKSATSSHAPQSHPTKEDQT